MRRSRLRQSWAMQHCFGALVAAVLLGCVRPSPIAPDAPAADLSRPAAAPLPLLVPRFTDIGDAAGLGGVAVQYVNWLDVDNDGRPDLLVDGRRLFRNVAEGGTVRFAEVTEAAGLAQARRGPALAVDVDNDGWADIVSTAGHLWRNHGNGTFADVAAAAGWAPHPKARTLAAGDLDNDGFADIYAAMTEDWNDGKPAYYPHQLWRNRGGSRFEEVGDQAGIDRKTYGRGVLVADVDGDGWQDIFVANYRLQPNLLWRNLGNGRFEDVARRFGVTGRKEPERYRDEATGKRYGPHYGHTIGACWLDFDNDGRLDLFTANLVHKYVGPTGNAAMKVDIRGYVCDDSAIYRRVDEGFEDWRARLGVAPMPIGGRGVFKGDELWSGCVAGDLNNDGWIDVFVPQIYNLPYARSKLFLNRAGETFEDHAPAAGITRLDTYAGALADVDGDGWLDVVTGGREKVGASPGLRLYRNTGGDAAHAPPRHWLRVRIVPGQDRRTVLGTVVSARLGDRTLTRLVSAGTSTYGQQDDPVLHFGLGAWAAPVRLSIRWPDGRHTDLAVPADTQVDIGPETGKRTPHVNLGKRSRSRP